MPKPGIRTTEFWLSLLQGLAGPVIAILIVSGVVSPDVDAEALGEGTVAAVSTAVESVVAIIALWRSATVTSAYTEARARVKTAGDAEDEDDA